MNNKSYTSVLIIGMGLIGSSIARVIKQKKISEKVFAIDNDKTTINLTKDLNIVDEIFENLQNFSEQVDLIFICTPLSSYKNIFKELNIFIQTPTLITDVGSTKVSVINDFKSEIDNDKISFLPRSSYCRIRKKWSSIWFCRTI